MFTSLGIVSLVFTAKEVIAEKTRPVAPPEQRFDWDKYWNDAKNHTPAMEVVKRHESGYYFTIRPKPVEAPVRAANGIADIKRYEEEKALYGAAIVSQWANNGRYAYIRK